MVEKFGFEKFTFKKKSFTIGPFVNFFLRILNLKKTWILALFSSVDFLLIFVNIIGTGSRSCFNTNACPGCFQAKGGGDRCSRSCLYVGAEALREKFLGFPLV